MVLIIDITPSQDLFPSRSFHPTVPLHWKLSFQHKGLKGNIQTTAWPFQKLTSVLIYFIYSCLFFISHTPALILMISFAFFWSDPSTCTFLKCKLGVFIFGRQNNFNRTLVFWHYHLELYFPWCVRFFDQKPSWEWTVNTSKPASHKLVTNATNVCWFEKGSHVAKIRPELLIHLLFSPRCGDFMCA